MTDMKREIELKLCGNLLRDWCRMLAAGNDSVEFEDSWCSGSRMIRFCTTAVDGLVENQRGEGDTWGLGRYILYEISLEPASLILSLSVSMRGLKRCGRERIRALADDIGTDVTGDKAVLMCWPLLSEEYSGNEALEAVEDAWASDIAFFERSLGEWLSNKGARVWRIPDAQRVLIPAAKIVDDLYVEGAEITILTDRFERSRAARKRCLAAHGTACAVCGIDFGREYGPDFAGKIEVHHKTPLNEIRHDYVVDPVNDLVPVCPNCHMIIHSKPGGTYTVDEVREMLARNSGIR